MSVIGILTAFAMTRNRRANEDTPSSGLNTSNRSGGIAGEKSLTMRLVGTPAEPIRERQNCPLHLQDLQIYKGLWEIQQTI